MTKTLVAIFDDIAVARQVVEDLVNAKFARNSISLITNDAHNQYSHYLDKDYTPKDDAVTAVQGAGFGALVGAFTGILVGAAALTIPGIGLAIVAGPIVAGLTGAVAGSVTGGVVGALVKSGVPQDDAPYYAEGIRRGGTLISVETSDTLRAMDIMNRYGSVNIHARSELWRQAGWQGFDADVKADDNEETVKPLPVMVTRATPITQPVSAPSVAPLLIEEPPVSSEDTSKTTAALVAARATDTEIPVIPPSDGIIVEPVFAVVVEPIQNVVEDELEADYKNTTK
jgi:hypothetical protein